MKTIERPMIDEHRIQRWHNKDGLLHREDDRPAIVDKGFYKAWYKNGILHRDNNKPAEKWYDGEKKYYKNGLLHRDDGKPAVIVIGVRKTKEYYLKGIYLTYKEYKSIIHNKITIKQITKETNIERRRLYIEYYGLDKYIIDSKAKIISQDEYGILYKKKQKNDEDIIMVKVKNSTPEHDGSHKFYFIRVPPSITSAKAAVAWTFGMLEDEYSPSIES